MKSDKLLLSWSTIKSNLSHDGVACAGCKSVRIPPYRISATALNKAEEDAGERFYALQLFTLGSCGSPASTPFPSFAAATSNALAGDYKGAIHQYFAHHTPPPLQSSLFEWLQGHPERIRKVKRALGTDMHKKCCLWVKFIFQSSQIWKITIKITHPSIAKQPFLALHVLYIFKPQRVEDWFLRFEKKTPMPLHSYVCPLSNWTGN